MSELPTDLNSISVADRLKMIQTIWDSIESSQRTLPLSDEEDEEQDRRFAARWANPDDLIPWDELKSDFKES